jgi:hypothetical protein
VPPKPPGSGPAADWGIYTLANDAVLDWVLALLESLRRYAPGIPVRVIPYDERQGELDRRLAARGHARLEHDEIERLGRLGRRFYPHDEFAARGFRKLAAFSGPFERFLFLDSDVVALGPLAPLLRAAERSTADLVHFDTDPEQVYRPGPLRDEIAAAGRAVGFNAGLFAARRGLLDADVLGRVLDDLGEDWTTSLVANAEQPFLNLFAARRGWTLAAASELLPGTCSTCWPAVGRIEPDGEIHRLRDSGRWDEGWPILFAHWAGIRLAPTMANREVWERFRNAAHD